MSILHVVFSKRILMNNIFHEGEHHIQEIMGVRENSDALSSMIRNTIPRVASDFLEKLNFSAIVISTSKDDLFSTTVYNTKQFITIININTICINLEKHSFMPDYFFEKKELNIGMIGLDFNQTMRIRINGKGIIKDNELYININEIYSNCPKYIKKRVLNKELKTVKKQTFIETNELNNDITKVINNIDTFFLSSSNNEKGLDISHKGGEKGFLKILSNTQLEFLDMPGNNLYNSLGNIYTNPYINIFFIDFENNNTYNIVAKAKINEEIKENKKYLKITITCLDILINKNSFQLDYK
jgi:hypothetical protein